MSGAMRRRKQKKMPRVLLRCVIGKRRALIGDDDPLFEERELEFSGAGEEKVKPTDE
jgi:hypothetical protein